MGPLPNGAQSQKFSIIIQTILWSVARCVCSSASADINCFHDASYNIQRILGEAPVPNPICIILYIYVNWKWVRLEYYAMYEHKKSYPPISIHKLLCQFSFNSTWLVFVVIYTCTLIWCIKWTNSNILTIQLFKWLSTYSYTAF